ncbi:MAG: methyltransferase domain-containing protein [Shimia sp.]
MAEPLITEAYRTQLAALHDAKTFGTRSRVPWGLQRAIWAWQPKTLLDFGCGAGGMLRAVQRRHPRRTVFAYDPVTFDQPLPEAVDLAYSCDVLEHVEYDAIDETLLDLGRRAKVQYHLIACHKALKQLPDGRNAHLIIETPDWWQEKLRALGFRIVREAVKGKISSHKPPMALTKYECVLVRD